MSVTLMPKATISVGPLRALKAGYLEGMFGDEKV